VIILFGATLFYSGANIIIVGGIWIVLGFGFYFVARSFRNKWLAENGQDAQKASETGGAMVEAIEVRPRDEPTRDWAVSILEPYFGGLTNTRATYTLNAPLPEKVWIYKLKDGMLTYNERLSFPWRPFMGTIGTAPEIEALSALTPLDHGGNMDVPDIRPGNTVYLPVRVPGALFFTGDCHGGQGQGELCGVALEISAKVTVRFELIKRKKLDWPRIESPDELMCVGSARPMEDAARIAYGELIKWMDELGWDRIEAYQALTQIGSLYVANMVDTYYSLVAKVEKKYAYRRS